MSCSQSVTSLPVDEITEYISNLIMENTDLPSLSSETRGYSFEFTVPSSEFTSAEVIKTNIELGDSYRWV